MARAWINRIAISSFTLLLACPADDPSTSSTASETSGDGDGDPAGDGDSGDGDGDGDGDSGDGDGDSGDGDDDEGLWLFFERSSLSEDAVEYVTVDISDLDLAGATEVHLGGPANTGPGWLGGTPFGSKIMRDGSVDMPVAKLLNLDIEGNFELVPLVPEGLPPYAPSPAWTEDASAAMVQATTGPSDIGAFHWVTYADKAPVAATPISGDHGLDPHYASTTLAEDDSGLLYVVDDDDDDIYELYYAQIDVVPGPLTQIGQLEAVSQFGARLDANKLYYRYDANQDGLRDLWVRDITNPIAAPVLINTVVAEGDTIRTKFSEDLQTLLYWTGEGLWGELYAVRFSGATPSAPVRVDSPELSAWTKDFEFDPDGRILYRFGTNEEGVRGIARLELIDGQPGPVELVTGALADDEDIELSLHSDGEIIYQVSHPLSQTRSLNYVDVSGPVATAPLRFADDIPDFLIAINFPTPDRRVVFVADMGNDSRQVMAVELDDPNLALVDLSAGLPAGWSVPISARVSPDGRQVMFVARSDNGDDEIAYRVRSDGSGALEALNEPGYELRLSSFMQP